MMPFIKRFMKRIISFVLAAALVFSLGITAFADNETTTGSDTLIERVDYDALGDFNDAPGADTWKYPGLNCAVANEVMNGHNQQIRPDLLYSLSCQAELLAQSPPRRL